MGESTYEDHPIDFSHNTMAILQPKMCDTHSTGT